MSIPIAAIGTISIVLMPARNAWYSWAPIRILRITPCQLTDELVVGQVEG